jgi:aminoglycoside phosphotransferase (APT) family kinase protein
MRYSPLPRKAAEFQQPPDAGEIEELCRRLLPLGARVVSAAEIGGGAFNHTFVIETIDAPRCILRVSPPYEHPAVLTNEQYLLRREVALAPALAPVLGPLLPAVLATDFSGEILTRDAVLTSFLEGDNWDAIKGNLTSAENDAIWCELGALVRRIHAVRGTAGEFGWPEPEESHGTWSGFLLKAARGLLLDFRRVGIPDTEVRAWVGTIEDGRPFLDEITAPHLVHGDPWPKNVLVRRGADGVLRISGLLDQERGLWGDPMNEWVFHLLDFPAPFWEAYGPRPTGMAAEFRACVYRGLIDAQVILEKWRCGGDDHRFRQRLIETATRMRRLIVEGGLS